MVVGASAPRLVFVEGLPGAGKSTTARRIAERLQARGVPAHAYHELADDNPIRTRGIDAIRANHPQVGRLPGVGPDGFALDPAVYAAEQWGALARRCASGDEVVVLESRYIQNSVQGRYMAGAPEHKVYEGFAGVHEQVRPAAPLLVYLRASDVAAAVRHMLAERGEPWAPWYLKTMTGLAWSKARRLEGVDAVVGFGEDWERVAAKLFEMHEGPKLRLTDPQRDWEAAMERIDAELGIA